jgi:hypothetical protein
VRSPTTEFNKPNKKKKLMAEPKMSLSCWASLDCCRAMNQTCLKNIAVSLSDLKLKGKIEPGSAGID